PTPPARPLEQRGLRGDHTLSRYDFRDGPEAAPPVPPAGEVRRGSVPLSPLPLAPVPPAGAGPARPPAPAHRCAPPLAGLKALEGSGDALPFLPEAAGELPEERLAVVTAFLDKIGCGSVVSPDPVGVRVKLFAGNAAAVARSRERWLEQVLQRAIDEAAAL